MHGAGKRRDRGVRLDEGLRHTDDSSVGPQVDCCNLHDLVCSGVKTRRLDIQAADDGILAIICLLLMRHLSDVPLRPEFPFVPAADDGPRDGYLALPRRTFVDHAKMSCAIMNAWASVCASHI